MGGLWHGITVAPASVVHQKDAVIVSKEPDQTAKALMRLEQSGQAEQGVSC